MVVLELAAPIDGRVAIAVSGGSDSVALLHLAVAQFGAARVVALTVDHGLRAEAAGEARQVAQWCAALHVEHHTLHWLGEKPHSGIQAAARQARYSLMSAWCLANGGATIMTAHTANDQAETVVMRKQRTDSLRSIAGIWPSTTWNGVAVVRPLLGETRCDLRAYLKTIGQGWLDDPSNSNEKFERVRVRNVLRLADVHDLAAEAKAAQRRVIAEDNTVKAWLQLYGRMSTTAVLTLDRAFLMALANADAEAVLRWAMWACGGGTSPEPSGVQRILQVVRTGAVTRMTLAGAVVAMRNKSLVIGREPGRLTHFGTYILGKGEVLWDNRFQIVAPENAEIVAVGADKRWKKLLPRDLPAFAAASLPVVVLADGQRILPHFEVAAGISVGLSERLHFS